MSTKNSFFVSQLSIFFLKNRKQGTSRKDIHANMIPAELTAEHNKDLVDAIVELANSKVSDESLFRRLFSQLGVICNDYVVLTRPGQRSVNGYFAVKGVKKQHKFAPEMDESMLESMFI